VAVLARESAVALRAERLALARTVKQRDWPGAGEMVPRQRRRSGVLALAGRAVAPSHRGGVPAAFELGILPLIGHRAAVKVVHDPRPPALLEGIQDPAQERSARASVSRTRTVGLRSSVTRTPVSGS
jgi:hypothetical protein